MRRVLVTGMSGTGKSATLAELRLRDGKSAEDQALILTHLREVESLLRATCTYGLDATQPLEEVVEQLVRIGADPG